MPLGVTCFIKLRIRLDIVSKEHDLSQKWTPFYLKLMNANFLRMQAEEQKIFVSDMKLVLKEIHPEDLFQMLKENNWRPQLTAGWFIGFNKVEELTDAVGKNLLEMPYYAGMYCFALARVGTPKASDYLESYLNQYLVSDYAQHSRAETLTLQYGLSALEWIAPEKCRLFYPEKWNNFTTTLFEYYTPDHNIDKLSTEFKNYWKFETAKTTFKQWIDFASQNFD